MEPVTYTFFVLAVTIALFIWGKIRADLVAILSFMALHLGGVLSVSQALSGFSNSTVIMIAALFVVGEGLSRTGVTTWLSRKIIAFAGNNPIRILVVLMFGTAVLSGFISNTGTVATLMPAVIAIAWSINTLPSKLLIPLAFAANAGGLLTLTGTPPNIVVSEALLKAGYQPFGYFEYGYIGLPLLIIAVLYIVFIGQKILPDKHSSGRPTDLAESMKGMANSFSLQGKLFLAYTGSSSFTIGKSLEEVAFGRDFQVSVLCIEQSDHIDQRDSRKQRRRRFLRKLRESSTVPPIPSRDCLIKPFDVMLIKGSPSDVKRAAKALNLDVEELDTTDDKLTQFLVTPEVGIAEVLVNPRSEYIGKSLQEGDFRQRYDVQVISILRREGVVNKSEARLEFGDALMIRASWDKIGLIQKDAVNFTVIGCPDELSKQVTTLNWRSAVALLSLVGMVIMLVTGIVPTVIATIIAAITMVLCGCIEMNKAYRSIGWQTVVLIAAMMPLSTALETTGGAELIAHGLVNSLGVISPLALMAGIFLLTSTFSQVISNTATALLMSPIVLQAAEVSGLSPYPLLITISVSASTAFITPIGTTTNLMVMTPGGYNFNDYIRVGAPLVVIFLIITLILVPLIWPLY